MTIHSSTEISVDVWERGVGLTSACGTGACAAWIAGRLTRGLDERGTVYLPGGNLDIAWLGEGESVWMTGPAEDVYEGVITV